MLSDDKVADILGTPKPAPRPAQNRVEATLNDVAQLDRRLSDHVESVRRPNESHEQATARVMAESPRLYSEHKKEKARLLEAGGHHNAASGQGF